MPSFRRFIRTYVPWLIIICTASAGIYFANWVSRRSDRLMREALLKNAQLIANSVNPRDVKALFFSPADRTNPSFVRMEDWMKRQVMVAGCRSLYSMIKRGNDIIFGPESLAVTDPLASPPGTLYKLPPAALVGVFSDHRPVTVGPYTDEYSTFVSAFAPVLDPETGGLLLVIGMDVEATDWDAEVKTHAALPVSLAALVILLLLLFEALSVLRVRGASLRDSQKRYHALFENSLDGILMITPGGKILAANSAAANMLGQPSRAICSAGMAGIAGSDPRVREFMARLKREQEILAELTLMRADNTPVQVEVSSKQFRDQQGEVCAALVLRDISERKQWEYEREKLITGLSDALANVKTLTGFLPICASCKKIRNDSGYWEQVEEYIKNHSEADFSHSLCPECIEKLYGDQEWYKKNELIKEPPKE